MVIKLPRSRERPESTPVAVTPPSTTRGYELLIRILTRGHACRPRTAARVRVDQCLPASPTARGQTATVQGQYKGQ